MLSQERRKTITDTSAKIQGLQHTRMNLVRQLTSIDAALRKAQIAMANVAPIHYVPDEILSLIFKFGYRQPRYKNHTTFTVTVSHVSQRWRAVAQDTPTIWTYLRLTGSQPVEYVEIFLPRSRRQPLELILSLDCETEYTWEEFFKGSWRLFMAYMDMLCPHVFRWRQFSLCVSYRIHGEDTCTYQRSSCPQPLSVRNYTLIGRTQNWTAWSSLLSSRTVHPAT